MRLLPAFTPARFASIDAALDRVFCCDALDLLRSLPDASINCVVTSPPYFGLRDYGVDGQIGLEDTPQAFVARLVAVFREVRRVLADDGVMWVNMGDTYTGGGRGSYGVGQVQKSNNGSLVDNRTDVDGLPSKSLLGIPWRLAFGLQDDGWILRSDVIWSKPNPMPESVTDRPTKAHEYVFLLSKSPRYWYDAEAIAEKVVASLNPVGWQTRKAHGATGGAMDRGANQQQGVGISHDLGGSDGTRNARSVWTIATQPTPFAHFATMPQKLVERCILAGCKPGGVVFDPFMGSGTTALVARRHGRRYIGSELNAAYVEICNKRLSEYYTLPLFTDSAADESESA